MIVIPVRVSAATELRRDCGAGRRYSRTKAKKLFTEADLAEQMAGKVWLSSRARALVDEIPTAYKSID